MPIKDDLIQRMLEDLGAAVRRVMRDGSDRARAEELLAAGYAEHVGASGALLKRLPSEQILATLSTAGTLDRERAHLLSALLDAEASLADVDDPDAAAGLRVRSLDLALEGALAGIEPEGTPERVDALLLALDEPPPPETEARLLEYALLHERWADAEDALLSLREQRPDDEALLARGREVYAAMLAADDAALAEEGLEREEVRAGAEAWG